MAKYRITGLPKAQLGKFIKRKQEPVQNWSGVQPQIVQPGADPFQLPVTPAIPEYISPEDLAWQEKLARFDQNLQKMRTEREDLSRQNIEDEFASREAEQSKAGKYDKIKPFREFLSSQWTPELEKTFRESGFIPIRNKGTGAVEVYPANEIAGRIINSGLRTNEIVNKLGIGNKEVIDKEFGDLMKAADQQYEATVIQKVLETSLEKGVSPDKAFDMLPKSLGISSEMKKRYLGKSQDQLKQIVSNTQKALEQANAKPSMQPRTETFGQEQPRMLTDEDFIYGDPEQKLASQFYQQNYAVDDPNSPYDPMNWSAVQARGKRMDQARVNAEKVLGEDLQAKSPGRESDQFSNYSNYYTDIANTQRRNLIDAAAEKAGRSDFDEALARESQAFIAPQTSAAYSQLFKESTDKALDKGNYGKLAQMMGSMQKGDYLNAVSEKDLKNKLESNLFQAQKTPSIQQGYQRQKPLENLSTLDKIQDVVTYFPDALKYSFGKGDISTMWDNPIYNTNTGEQLSYRDLKELNKQGAGIDLYGEQGNDVGNFLNTFNPIRLGYESRKNVEAGRYGDLAFDVASSLSPFYAGKALSGIGRGLKATVNYAPIKVLPKLNLQNAVINPYFAYEALKPEGDFEQAYDAYQQGNYGEAAALGTFGALSVSPYYKSAKSLYNIGQGLRTPGTTQKFMTNLPFSAAYKSPLGSGLAIQSRNWAPNTAEILPGFTSRFNKVLGPTLGEIKLYGNQSRIAPETQKAISEGRNWKPFGMLPAVQQVAPFRTGIPQKDLRRYATTSADEAAVIPYNPITGGKEVPMTSALANASFRPFSPGYNAEQTMRTLAQSGRQPLLQRGDFATDKQMRMDEIYSKYPDRNDPERYNKMMDEAAKYGISADEMMMRSFERMGNQFSSQRPWGERNIPFSFPENPRVANYKILNQNPFYTDFSTGKPQLGEFGNKGGKSNVSFGDDLSDFTGKPLTGTQAMQNQVWNMADSTNPMSTTGQNPVNPEVLKEITQAYRKLSPSEIEFNPQREKHEVIASVIDDVREDKIKNWSSREGQRRLQKMIDETPILKVVDTTPEDFITAVKSMDNINLGYLNQLNELDNIATQMLQLDSQFEQGLMSQNDWFNKMVELENAKTTALSAAADLRTRLMQDKGHNANVKFSNANSNFNVAVGENMSPSDLKQIVEHEIGGHVLQHGVVTSLDKELAELELVDDDLFSQYPTEISEGFKAFKESPGYVGTSKEYFLTGSEGTEKLPFLLEVRQDMLDRGIIKNIYDPITTRMLKTHYENYKKGNLGGKDIPLRLFDIIKDKNQNFNIMSKVINNAPAILLGTGAAGAAAAGLPEQKYGGSSRSKLKKFIQ